MTGTGTTMRGAMVAYTNLPEEYKEKYHCDPYELGMKLARENRPIVLSKNLAYSLATLEQAKAKAKAEKKLIGFILVWDSFFVTAPPMERGSDCGLAHFYYTFHDNVVLVFVHHENELDKIPGPVRLGFLGPEEGGFAPNMCVVNSDCSEYVCEIPYGGDHSNGAIREKIFRDKIAVMKKYVKDHPPQ